MKAVNVSELKANLSKYLRMASRGTQIIVKDRDESIAQIGPLQRESQTWRERLAREGRLRPGTQDWAKLRISKLKHRIDVQSTLNAVREDPHEVRRH
jgi:antitoxin (DNA-binding transcriptional repressor) of toxin-antitoxin stability system